MQRVHHRGVQIERRLDLKKRFRGLHALRNTPVQRSLRLVERRAAPEVFAELPVAAMLAERRGHQVADSRQTEESLAMTAHEDTETHHFRESPCDHGGLRVGTVP